MKLCVEERILLLGERLDNLKAGGGDYSRAQRALEVDRTTIALDDALAELRVEMVWGPRVIH